MTEPTDTASRATGPATEREPGRRSVGRAPSAGRPAERAAGRTSDRESSREPGRRTAGRVTAAERAASRVTAAERAASRAAAAERAAVRVAGRTVVRERPRYRRRPSTVWAAFLAAVTAAVAGLAVIGAVVLVGWGLAPARASATGAVRLAVQAWLLGHHARLQLPLGDVGLAPLGLTLLPTWLLYRAGGSVARSLAFDQAEYARVATAVKAVAALAGTYAVLVVLGTGLADTDTVRVDPVSTLAGAGLLAAGAGTVGLLRGSPLAGRLLDRLPAGARSGVRAALRAGLAALGVLLAAGALLAGAALVADHTRAGTLSRALAPGFVDGTGLLLLGLLCVPNAAVWAAGFAVGPGFAVGAGTSVTAFGVTLGPVPAFPLLAALPDTADPPGLARLALAAPVLAGILAGAIVGRVLSHAGGTASGTARRTGGRAGGRAGERADIRADRADGRAGERADARTGTTVAGAAAWAGAAGAGAGAALAVLAVLAGGPLGAGRMAALGPSPWQVGLAAAAVVGATAAACAAVTVAARRRSAAG